MKIIPSYIWRDLKKWYRVSLSTSTFMNNNLEIANWIETNGTEKQCCYFWNEFYFQDEQDAVLFALKWS